MAARTAGPLDVGIVGIGGIAAKAYLPLLATWPGIRLHLATRDEQRLAQAERAFRPASTAPDLSTLLARGLDAVFVTAATDAHPELVATALRAGVAVHVDKPLADSAAAAERLVGLAETLGVPLAVGLNRRFAPAYRRAADVRPHLAVLHKHRPDLADDLRRVVFDDLIHVIDTLRWLLDAGADDAHGAAAGGADGSNADGGPDADAGELTVTGRVVDGRLHHVALTLRRDDRHAVGLMDRMSGATRERLEAHGGPGTVIVDDVARVETRAGAATTTERPGDWTPTLQVRGFTAMLDDFLDAVAAGRPPSVPPRDALATHRVCETVVASLNRDQRPSGGTAQVP